MATKKHKIVQVSFNTPTKDISEARLTYGLGKVFGGSTVKSIKIVPNGIIKITFEDGDYIVSNMPSIIQYSNRY